MSNKDLLDNIKKLREMTGVGFKDCKLALDETKGDLEKSVEFLRKKGIAKASKKMSRTASEGLALVKASEGKIASEMINDIVAEPEVGKIYEGKVVKTTDFGAFVNFMGSRDGLVHISQLKEERVEKTTDVVKEGDMVKVKVIGVDDRGKVKLSIKDV